MPCWKGCTTWKGGRRIHWSFSNAPFQCFNDYWTEKNWSVFFFPSFFCPAKANLKGCHSRSTLEANSLICHTSIAALSVFSTHTQTHTYMPSGYLSLCLEVVVLLHVFEVQPVFWEIHLFTILPRSISIPPSVQSYLHRFQMYNWSHTSVQIQTSHVFTVSSFFLFCSGLILIISVLVPVFFPFPFLFWLCYSLSSQPSFPSGFACYSLQV